MALWIDPSRLAQLPTSGAAWDRLKAAAGQAGGPADLSNQDSGKDLQTLAAALVAARTGDAGLKAKVQATLATIRGRTANDDGGPALGRALAVARNLPGYVIAADLIGYRTPEFEAGLRRAVTAPVEGHSGGKNVIETARFSMNNWGCHARAAVACVAVYLGDAAMLDTVTKAQKAWLGEGAPGELKPTPAGDAWRDLSKPKAGVNPRGSVRSGANVDGVLPEDQRRENGGTPTAPGNEGYVWEGLQGALVASVVLARAGRVPLNAGDSAILRAVRWLLEVNEFPPSGDDAWQAYLLNSVWGLNVPLAGTGSGKNMGFTDWTHATPVSEGPGSPPEPLPDPEPTPTPDPDPGPSPGPTPHPTPDPTPDPEPVPSTHACPLCGAVHAIASPGGPPSPGPTPHPTPDPTPPTEPGSGGHHTGEGH